MTITAKFPGKCARCGGAVAPGEKIEWSKGAPIRHSDCSAAPTENGNQKPRLCACGRTIQGSYRQCYRCAHPGGDTDSAGNRISTGASYRAGVTAPAGRCCPECGERDCAKAWDIHDLCDED